MDDFERIQVQAKKIRKQQVIDVFDAEFKNLENRGFPPEVKKLYKEKLIQRMQQILARFDG